MLCTIDVLDAAVISRFFGQRVTRIRFTAQAGGSGFCAASAHAHVTAITRLALALSETIVFIAAPSVPGGRPSRHPHCHHNKSPSRPLLMRRLKHGDVVLIL